MNSTSFITSDAPQFNKSRSEGGSFSFLEIEEQIIKDGFRIICQNLKRELEQIDTELYEDCPANLRFVAYAERTLLTEIGDVKFKRRRYQDECGNYVYLLDEELDLPYKTRISPRLSEFIVDMASDISYAKTCKILARNGASLSPKTVMHAVHNIGELCREEDENEAYSLYCNGVLPAATNHEDIVNIEADGTYVPLQNGKKVEISALIAYPRKVYEGGKMTLDRPVHFGMVGNLNEFWTQGFAKVGTRFSLSDIKQINMGFDGEAKYKNGDKYCPVSAKITGQLDKFHLNRYIASCLKDDSDAKNQVISCMYEGMAHEGAELLRKYAEMKGAVSETTEKVIRYIKNNSEYINCGYISLGSMESDQQHSYKGRMAKAPCGWSVCGVDSMARIRSRGSSKMKLPKYTREKSIYPVLKRSKAAKIKRSWEEVESVFQKTSGKGFEYPTRISGSNLPKAVKYAIGYLDRKSD